MLLKRSPVTVNPAERNPLERVLSLDGKWSFSLDEKDLGERQQWYLCMDGAPERIDVPGSVQGQGFGNAENNLVVDFWYETRVFKGTYEGVAWYGKSFELPEGWRGDGIWLNFGGAAPTAKVWVNGALAGENHAPFIPFGFDVTALLREGENRIAVRISEDDRALMMGYNFMGKWSGLYRGVELRAVKGAYIDEVRVRPDADAGEAVVLLRCRNAAGCAADITVRECASRKEVCRGSFPVGGGDGFTEIRMECGPCRKWSPDDPFLYVFEIVLKHGEEVCDAASERCGFVKVDAAGKHFRINGEPYYMRGTGDFFECPETACPDTDRERWRRKLRTLREYGYNYVRCQSYVPNPEYLDAADEVGLIVQAELGMLGAICGSNKEHVYQWPQPNAGNYKAILDQWLLAVRRDANRPSSRIYNMSNELAANRNYTEYPRIAWKCYRETKKINPNCMVIWTDGGHNEELPSDFVNDDASVDAQSGLPVIQHEYQWWSSYPDIRTADKFGGAIRPYHIEIAREAMLRHGTGGLMREFADVSQHLQYAEAKGKMERCRRDHPMLAGICHFNAMDTLPSPQGVLDVFYEKKLIGKDEWLRTNGDCVLLSSLEFDDRCYEAGGNFQCRLYVSDFSHPSFAISGIDWRIEAGGSVLCSGSVPAEHVPYCTYEAGCVSVRLPRLDKPAAALLKASVSDRGRTVYNEWRIWIFPDRRAEALPAKVASGGMVKWLDTLGLPRFDGSFDGCGVLITDAVSSRVLSYIEAGGRVLLASGDGLKRAFHPQGIIYGSAVSGHYFFSNPACYPTYEDGQHGTMIERTAMLGDFPCENYADMQFYNLIANAPPIDIEPLGLCDAPPAMRMIHCYQTARPLAELLERSHGKGRLVVTSMDLSQTRVEARYMLHTLVGYLLRDRLPAAAELNATTIGKLLEAAEIMDP